MIAFLVGFVSFLLAGFGLGGGVLLIPLITFLFSFEQSQAKYIALIGYLPAAIGVIISCVIQKNAEFKKILPLIPFGLAGAICGAYISLSIDTGLLRKIYSAFLIVVGGYMCFNTIQSNKKTHQRGHFD